MSPWRHVRAIGLLPALNTILVPGIILWTTGSVDVGFGLANPWRMLPVLVGGGLIALGLGLMYRTVSLFATAGEGTLAPWDPPRKLVISGPYRHVRNPMITGAFCIIAGETLVLGSAPLLIWFGAFVAANALWMPLVEEPGLERRFGADYVEYKREVPRWVPRLRPWAAGLGRS